MGWHKRRRGTAGGAGAGQARPNTAVRDVVEGERHPASGPDDHGGLLRAAKATPGLDHRQRHITVSD
jgi:hypothetical protein